MKSVVAGGCFPEDVQHYFQVFGWLVNGMKLLDQSARSKLKTLKNLEAFGLSVNIVHKSLRQSTTLNIKHFNDRPANKRKSNTEQEWRRREWEKYFIHKLEAKAVLSSKENNG